MLQQIKNKENFEISAFCEQVLRAVILLFYHFFYLEEVIVIADFPKDLSDDLQFLKDFMNRYGSFLILYDEIIYFVYQSVKNYFIDSKDFTIFF
jgi:hypothetical protein